MSYKRSQQSDRDGSFPEPPCGGMAGGECLVSSKNRFRRSLVSLKCFSRWSKQSRGPSVEPTSNYVFSGLDIEDSWESGAGEEDFEVRSTSPPRSDDGVFDVSQALQAVPEDTEEEEEESQNQVFPNECDATSEGSKPSDYSSEFMTDDSTETSGLPWDSSFSQHGSTETPDVELRIGIRPFEIPLDLGRTLNAESGFILEMKKDELQNATCEENPTIDQTPRDNESNQTDKETQDGFSESGEQNSDTPGTSSDAYSDEIRDVLELFNDAQSLASSIEKTKQIWPCDLETSADVSRQKVYQHSLPPKHPKHSDVGTFNEFVSGAADKPSIEPFGRVKELMKKFGGYPGKTKDNPTTTRLKSSRSLDTSASEIMPSFSAKSFEVSSEIPRHDVFHADGANGFFWRSRPFMAHHIPKLQEEELINTSISTTEGNQSMEYSDVFSQEELDREYFASGEPTFIHI